MRDFWCGKKVFLTGHTGFKGSWLSIWLNFLGAEVLGYALKPPAEPALFSLARLTDKMESMEGDILDYPKLRTALTNFKPDIIIHMAAQALVRHSYRFPLETLSTNIIGTANVLEAARYVDNVQAVLAITSDKCYENREWIWGYRESEPMGGHDPYSCSKGCAELVIASYRRSFFSSGKVGVASARAGNVIGGGDWSLDRIIPDSIRAVASKRPVLIRNPMAVRPWQHVLEPLAGYLLLIEKLWQNGSLYADGWNFGPSDNRASSVRAVVDTLCHLWGNDAKWQVISDDTLHEAHYLKLDSSKACYKLGWQPILNLQDTLSWTVMWYKRFYGGEDAYNLTLEQIAKYHEKSCEVKYIDN